MIDPITTAKIFSTLGNNSSLIPLGIKDVSNTLGMTAGSYISGGNVEGKDRLIDEMGAQVIWLLGIPFFKKVIDKTVYKAAGYNSKFDVRTLKNKGVMQKAIEYAPSEKIKASMLHASENAGIFKKLAVGKFIVSTALTMVSYATLTHFRHKHTEKALIEEIKLEDKKEQEQLAFKQKQKAESANKNENNIQQKPSFGSRMNAIEQFMFDPVKNTMIVDGGITTERLTESRNPQDFMGYVVKEGGFWAFMYFIGPAVQKHMENKSALKNKPIDLDIRVLQDENFKQAFKDKSIEKHLSELPKAFEEYANNLPAKGDSQAVKAAKEAARQNLEPVIYESLFKKENNLLIKMMKKSEIIKTVVIDGKEKIDTQSFIDIKEVVGTKEKVKKLYAQYKMQSANGGIETFFKKVLSLKRGSIIKNIGVSIGALGLLVPGIMVAMRYLGEGNKEFQVKKELKEKFKKNRELFA